MNTILMKIMFMNNNFIKREFIKIALLNVRFRKFLLPLATSLSLLWAGPGFSQEMILSYHSEIDIAVDASMIVTETIRVRAEGRDIQRGIYRDFPTRYTDNLGNRYVVDFEVLGITRDGISETWSAENRSNGVRVYIGREDVTLTPSEYTYAIRYRTNRQIGFFEDHDELYWNVTGNGWGFFIQQASANVNLPISVAANDLSITGYTGAIGERGQLFSSNVSDGQGHIESTALLQTREGLTLVMTWPKGVITEPSLSQEMNYLFTDNIGLLLAIVCLLLSFYYLYINWSRVGRDPEAGIIFPHYDPPKGYSPASTRYIRKMGYDGKTLTAAILNLAVHGYITINEEKKKYTLEKKSSDQPLAAGEKALLSYLFIEGDTLELDNENHALISKAKKMHRKALSRDYLNIYFSRNSLLILPSAIGSLLVGIVLAVSNEILPLSAALFLINFLMHIVFLFLMRAPSRRGRLLLDKLDGFKLYLEVAEKDDLELKHPPNKTPELFERYLPFAIALGVEQAWADQFTAVFAALESQGQGAYRPIWYYGSFNALEINGFTKNMSSTMSTAISAAATAPGSTSGGGGFSGGGGGGGGGGGW